MTVGCGSRNRNAAGTATLSYYNYSYDNADRVTLQFGTGATETYAYDADGQVLSDGSAAYGYDPAGNRNTAGYSVGGNNRVLPAGVQEVSRLGQIPPANRRSDRGVTSSAVGILSGRPSRRPGPGLRRPLAAGR
jgi:YD repeat-containing protein